MAERTIFLKKRPIRKEGIADSQIVPGMLVKLAADGKFDPHGTAGAPAVPAFAFEKELWPNYQANSGLPIADAAVDAPYIVGDRLLYGVCSSGAEVYALVAAGAAAIAAGDLLESAGDGTLRKQTPGDPAGTPPVFAGNAIAQALEAVNNSAGASRARIIVEIL